MEITIPSDARAVYGAADKSVVDCEVEVSGRRVPFSAHKNDSEPHGRAIYEALIERGNIEPYVEPARPAGPAKKE